MEDLKLLDGWIVPARDLSARFVRSGGPGGQNVNKVATKVELRLQLTTTALSDGQRARLAALFPSQVLAAGEVVITSDEHRSQALNLESARKRLQQMILAARLPPRRRVATKPSRRAKQRRLDAKKHRGQVKQLRKAPKD